MEESAEKRRERLRALREEASLASNGEERERSSVAPPSDPSSLPLPGDLQQFSAPASPSPRFEFYTDPLAAFSGSQKKRSKNSLGSPIPYGAAAPPLPCKSPPSPFWKTDPNMRPSGHGLLSSYPNLPSPGSPFNPNANPYQVSTGNMYSGNFNTPNTNPSHNAYSSPSSINPNVNPYQVSMVNMYSGSPNRSGISDKFTSPGSFCTPGSDPNMTPQGGYNNPPPSLSKPPSGFGSPQPISASQMYNGAGSEYSNTSALNQYNQGSGGFSTDSHSHQHQHRAGGVNDAQNNIWNQNGMNSGRSQGSNRSRGSYMYSPGSFMQSPGSSGRGNRIPGRSGGRGFQRASNEASAITNPELFAKRSMLVDPWKDLIPVRFESVASRLNACTVAGSRDWLPKSVSKGMVSPSTKGFTVSAAGPSLAESLEASYADAVLGEDGA